MKKILLPISLVALGLAPCQAEPMWALTSGNRVLRFDTETPGKTLAIFPISGLPDGESIIAIDFRPATGELYALQTGDLLYRINKETGAATPLARIDSALNGDSFGFDFDPVADQIRVVSDIGQNIRVNPTSGETLIETTSLAYAPSDPNVRATPVVVGAAYTNNFAGAAATVLYELDSADDCLVIHEPAGKGSLKTIGKIGLDVTCLAGFDISGRSGIAYMSSPQQLFTVNLATGTATAIGAISESATLGSEKIIDVAAPTVPPFPHLLNVSTRGEVGGPTVLIAGFITRGGTLNSAFLIRGLGPSLGSTAVSSPLPDPELALYDSNGVQLETNNNWRDSPQQSTIQLTGLAPSHDLESAIFALLPAGTYTAILRSHAPSGGIGLLEIYYL